MSASFIADVPFYLRANDIVKHVLNIDSRFRSPDPTSTTSDFYFRLLTPVRNVLRIRITSIEFPNNYYNFSLLRRNVAIHVIIPGPTGVNMNVRISDGNYTVQEMIDALLQKLTPIMPNISIRFSGVTGKFTFTWDSPFILDTRCFDGQTYDRLYDYGLGFNLGFSRGVFDAVTDVSGYTVVSDQTAFFAGDSYVFLKINDFDCVRQTVVGNDFTALAKIVVNQPKDSMAFDDYASQHAKEVTFHNPYDLTRFRIQLLDAYGNEVDMGSSQFSFSMEVLEVRNLSLYNTIRDSFADSWKV